MRRAVALGTAIVVAAVGGVVVTPSAATWTDAEHVRAGAAATDCTQPGTVDATAWGRMLTGTLTGADLANVAAIDGITVSNTAPATTSTASTTGAATDLGDDAWSTDLALSALSSLDVGAGIPLPFGTNTGVVTQYGRATSTGVSVGASGAVTASSGGLVSLEAPGSATPRLAELRLSTLLDGALPGLGVAADDLADVALRLGALGAIAELDSCGMLWDGAASPGDALDRDYLVDDLGLEFTSATVTDAVAAIRGSVNGLEATLDGLAGPGTSITGGALTAIRSTLNSILDFNLLGVRITLASLDTATIGIDFELDPVIAAVTGEVDDGVVRVDLGTGRVRADLAALFDAAYDSGNGLNGLAPNTSVLTPEVLAELTSRVGTLVSGVVGTSVQPLVTAALQAGTVTVDLGATLRTCALLVDVLGLKLQTRITGSIASFTGVAGAPAPVVATTVSQAAPGILNSLLSLLGLDLGTLTTALVNTVAGPLVTTLVPVVGAQLVTPLLASATTTATSAVNAIAGPVVSSLAAALSPVLAVLRTLVDVTVNARPDAAGAVGSPASAADGRFFQTALHVGVVDGAQASVAELFVANASVGPNSLR